MRSDAKTVDEYLASLPTQRREVMTVLRETVREYLPRGYAEVMNWGMIAYELPLETYPDTYNRKPLPVVALAAQKNYYAIYLTCVYQNAERLATLQKGFADAGRKLDMGKSCIRFKRVEDVPLTVIGKLIAATPPKVFIREYEAARANAARQRRAGKNPCEA